MSSHFSFFDTFVDPRWSARSSRRSLPRAAATESRISAVRFLRYRVYDGDDHPYYYGLPLPNSAGGLACIERSELRLDLERVGARMCMYCYWKRNPGERIGRRMDVTYFFYLTALCRRMDCGMWEAEGDENGTGICIII